MRRPIVLASSNPTKRRQLRWLLEGLPLDPVEPTAPLGVPETSSNLTGNAAAKALTYSGGGLAVASDGGLVVPALAVAWDPLLTGREGQAGLRRLAAGLADRRVRWSEAVAISEGGHIVAAWTASGTEGLLAPEPWPEPSDFWVWDIFYFPSLGKLWSALTENERTEVDSTWMELKRQVQAYFRAG